MMKILLTGKGGQVGFELQRALASLGDVHAVDQPDCDMADGQAIRRLVRSFQPDIIINPAAYTAVDKAEAEPQLAHAVNAVAPGVLGEVAENLGALVVHYSTDYVFDGMKNGAYTEDDATNPQSVYGRTKRDGEMALQKSGARHLVFRTSWVVGAHGANFASRVFFKGIHEKRVGVGAGLKPAPTEFWETHCPFLRTKFLRTTLLILLERLKDGADSENFCGRIYLIGKSCPCPG